MVSSITPTHPGSRRVLVPAHSVPVCSGRSARPPRWLCSDTDPRSARLPRRCGRHTVLPAGSLLGRSYTLHRDIRAELRHTFRRDSTSNLEFTASKKCTTTVKGFQRMWLKAELVTAPFGLFGISANSTAKWSKSVKIALKHLFVVSSSLRIFTPENGQHNERKQLAKPARNSKAGP